jgi:hypothetical protein
MSIINVLKNTMRAVVSSEAYPFLNGLKCYPRPGMLRRASDAGVGFGGWRQILRFKKPYVCSYCNKKHISKLWNTELSCLQRSLRFCEDPSHRRSPDRHSGYVSSRFSRILQPSNASITTAPHPPGLNGRPASRACLLGGELWRKHGRIDVERGNHARSGVARHHDL